MAPGQGWRVGGTHKGSQACMSIGARGTHSPVFVGATALSTCRGIQDMQATPRVHAQETDKPKTRN